MENMEEVYASQDSICKPARPGHVIFPKRRNFTSHVALCQKMRGSTSVIQVKNIVDIKVGVYIISKNCRVRLTKGL